MWCTRWFLPLLLLPLPTAPPYFLLLFLLTLALHARPCFYCIILIAALFLSSCYWQSFPLDAHLSVPWADNITTFSDALNATMPPHLNSLAFTPPIVRVADRCWCDFASGLFEPYDVQKWERDSVQRAVAQLEKEWKQTLEVQSDISANATTSTGADPSSLELPQNATHASSIRDETLSTIFRSLFSRRSIKPKPPPAFSSSTNTTPPPETPAAPSAVQPSIPLGASLAPGQLDMQPFGFDLILDFRWYRGS